MLCRLWIFFFKIDFFENFFQEYYKSLNQFRSCSDPTFCRARIWVQTVCKSYHQTTRVCQVNTLHNGHFFRVFVVCGIFQNRLFFKSLFQEYYKSVKQFWILIRPNVVSCPDLATNCLQKLSPDDMSMSS